MIYQTFAQLYDQLFDSDMYKSWEQFTLANINKKNCKLLDLAGGSGRLAVLLAMRTLSAILMMNRTCFKYFLRSPII